MMDVVNADVGGEPAQKARQGIVRAAVKRHLLQIPRSVVSPYGILKLVLNIEQPDPGRGRQQHDWQMHKQEWTDADEPYHDGDKRRDGDIGRAGAKPALPTTTHQADWEPMWYDEQIGRGQAEHDASVPVNANNSAALTGRSTPLIMFSVNAAPSMMRQAV